MHDPWIAQGNSGQSWVFRVDGELALLLPNFKETPALLWYLGGRGDSQDLVATERFSHRLSSAHLAET